MNNKMIAKTAITATLSFVLGYIESLFPLSFTIPGIKLGLSNLAIVYALYCIDTKTAWGISFIKVFLSSLLFSGFGAFLFSLFGAIFSLLVMTFSKKTNLFSLLGTSALGGVFHNTGQLLAAFIVLKTSAVAYYFAPLLLSGIITGVLIGTTCNLMIKHIKF